MCGIVGYTGPQNALPILMEGLKKLEYRGYDSAGIALQGPECLRVYKSRGEINNLEVMVEGNTLQSGAGIGHTRWATHGRPSDENAHPHSSCCGEIVVVHNGIIENYTELKRDLEEEGHIFKSETDTEVLSHLIEKYYKGNLASAVFRALEDVRGSYALVALSCKEEGRLVCARKDSPLVIGPGEGENFIASDIPALLNHTREVLILEDGEMATVTPEKVEIFNVRGEILDKKALHVNWDAGLAEKGGYSHFMLKEIMEQPRAVRETLRRRLDPETGTINLPEFRLSTEEINSISKIHIIACGTAYHAGIVAKYLFEKLLRISTGVDLASEFRYRDPLVSAGDLAIVISQSGETADTLAAQRLAAGKGARILAVTNVVGSSVSRDAHDVIYTRAGPEIAVASTKAYVTQLVALSLLGLYLAKQRGLLKKEEERSIGLELAAIPEKISRLLTEEALAAYRDYSAYMAEWENAFFIGRNLDYAVALEGSLKLKEISYIHAEAYPAGELKHGSLALITDGLPVIALATQGSILEKTISNVQEVKARDGNILLIASQNTSGIREHADTVITLPETVDLFFPILAAVPLQLIAYYSALKRDCPIDKPRNLAKSVTVE